MIELLDRQSTLKLNKTFTSFIIDVQDAKYNPVHSPYESGTMYFDDSEKPRYVSQDECDKWNKERLSEFNQNKDTADTDTLNDKYIDEVVFTFSEHQIDQYLDKLSNGLDYLTEQLDWKAVIFLLDYPTPWLNQENDYQPVKKALDYIRQIGVSEDFIGGFKVSGQGLKEITKNLFWIIRCNASLPDCYFSGLSTDFSGSICKYGNIHFNFYSRTDRQEIIRAAQDIGLKQIEGSQCLDSFTETGKIEGRRIIV